MPRPAARVGHGDLLNSAGGFAENHLIGEAGQKDAAGAGSERGKGAGVADDAGDGLIEFFEELDLRGAAALAVPGGGRVRLVQCRLAKADWFGAHARGWLHRRRRA